MQVYQNTLEIGQKRILLLKEIKNTVPWTYITSDLEGEEIVGTFCKIEL